VRRLLAAVTTAVLYMTLLTGCGSGGGDDTSSGAGGGYCSDLGAFKDSFVGLLNNQIDQDTFVRVRDELPTLEAEAPAGLKDDWTTVTAAVDSFSAAMRKAGLTMDDMRAMGQGSMPGGIDMRTVMDAAAALGSAHVSTAQSAIAANALKVCSLGLS
jgi:hypothetical protein